MPSNRSRFVLLRYSPPSLGAKAMGIDVLVLYRDAASQVHIRPQWWEGLSPKDREYLDGLIEDWEQATEFEALLRELDELCVGPLKAVDSGMLDGAGRERLIAAVCGNQSN